ncbi:MAG: helix-turn-helix transcriptional regulator [Chthoniobacter sp.]|nr:helix-turn-helix transcriptional regulator [Chthoniobacter sp.]
MIRKRRLDLGLRQADVAEIVGCDTMTVVNWEKGHSALPQINHMAGVVEFLGFNPLPGGDTVAERLVNHRKVRGLTQKVFAAQLGVDQSTLAKWERGERKPIGLFLSAVLAAMEARETPLRSSVNVAEIQVPKGGWGKRLLQYRAGQRLSQLQLAARIGVDQTTVARWESGKHRPTGLWLKALVAELSVSR